MYKDFFFFVSLFKVRFVHYHWFKPFCVDLTEAQYFYPFDKKFILTSFFVDNKTLLYACTHLFFMNFTKIIINVFFKSVICSRLLLIVLSAFLARVVVKKKKKPVIKPTPFCD